MHFVHCVSEFHLPEAVLLLSHEKDYFHYLFSFEAALVAQQVKNSHTDAVDMGSISGLGLFPGEGNGNHSSVPAGRLPWTEEPGRL